MNIVLIFPEEWPGNASEATLTLTGRRARHVAEIIQPAPGDTLKVGIIDGDMGLAQVLSCSSKALTLAVSLTEPPPPPLPLTLILALPRPKAMRRLMQSCSSLGIKEIYLINSYRVEKSYWQSPFLAAENIREQLLLGLEQGRDTKLPNVYLKPRFKPFVEDELPALSEDRPAYTAHPLPTAQPCPTAVKQPTLLAIGPEGGFISYEVNKLADLGFQPVTLGPRILRVETAVPALVAKMCY